MNKKTIVLNKLNISEEEYFKNPTYTNCYRCNKKLLPWEEILLGDLVFCDKCSENFIKDIIQ